MSSARTGDGRRMRILLVEDSPGDVLLTREALREVQVDHELHVVGDGEQALAFLRREDEYADVPRPDLVLLDLNLPRKNGQEVLEEVKHDPDLRRIPVIMLTTSGAERDVAAAYDRHVNSYIRKPVELEAFLEVVRGIESYWAGYVALPPR